MIHWSVRYTKKPLYRFEVEKLNLMLAKGLRPSKSGVRLGFVDTILYRWKLRLYWLEARELSGRAVRKLWRILTHTPPTD